MPARLSP